MKTLLLGLGNPILGDDGVGLTIAAAVGKRLPASAPVEVDQEHNGGLRLMERLIGYDRAVIVDAIVTGRHPPGTILRLTPDDMATQHTASAHDVSLPTALRLAEETALRIPQEIRIVAVEAESVLEFSETLTPAVAAAVPAAVEAVFGELGLAPIHEDAR